MSTFVLMFQSTFSLIHLKDHNFRIEAAEHPLSCIACRNTFNKMRSPTLFTSLTLIRNYGNRFNSFTRIETRGTGLLRFVIELMGFVFVIELIGIAFIGLLAFEIELIGFLFTIELIEIHVDIAAFTLKFCVMMC